MAMPRSQSDWLPLTIRFVLGVVFMVHGYHKLFTPSRVEQYQIDALVATGYMTQPSRAQVREGVEVRSLYKLVSPLHRWGWPKPLGLAWAAALTEFVGGALVLIGFLTRVGALGLMITMGVAVFVYHWEPTRWNILDVRWAFDYSKGQAGWEYPGVLLILAASVCVGGPGRLSVDGYLFKLLGCGHDQTDSCPPN